MPNGNSIIYKSFTRQPLCGLLIALLLGGWATIQPFSALWPVLPCLIWLGWQRQWWLIAAGLLMFAYASWRQLPEHTGLSDARCHVVFAMRDFPRFYPPHTQAIEARVQSSQDCPTLNGWDLSLRDYALHKLNPVLRYSAEIKLNDKGLPRATLRHLTGANGEAGWVMQWRSALATRISTHYPTAQARWLNALLLGNRNDLTAQDRQVLQYSGTSHLLAISGLHLALVTLTIFFLTQAFWAFIPHGYRIIQPRSLALIMAVLSGLGFVLLTGGHAPVWRAWLMLLCIALSWFIPRIQGGLNGLALAAIILLLADPTQIDRVSAWLSFIAVAVVLLVYQRWGHVRPLWLWLILQSVITLALMPIIWAIFGGISLVAVWCNLIVVPWLAPVWLLSMAGLFSRTLADAASWLLAHYLSVIDYAAARPHAYIIPDWQPNLVSATAIMLALLWLILSKRKKWLAVACLLPVGVQIFNITEYDEYRLPHQEHVAVLFHGRDAYVINAGYAHRSGQDDAKRHLLPAIRRRGATIKAIILTDDRIMTTSALNTLASSTPDNAIYSVSATSLRLPFPIRYCPPEHSDGIQFQHSDTGCRAIIANHWLVHPRGIDLLERQ